MKTKNIFWISFLAALLFLFAQAVYAQEITSSTKIKTAAGKTKTTTKAAVLTPESRVESLSGISLFPNRKTGSFSLRFSQSLKDTASLELKNSNGYILYALALTPSEAPMPKPVDVGKLQSGLYLIEVRSANTVYWKKVRIRN